MDILEKLLKLTGEALGERGAPEHNAVFDRLYPQFEKTADDREGYIRQNQRIAAARADDMKNRARHRRADQAAAQGRRPVRGGGFDGEGEWRGGERHEPAVDRVERQIREGNEQRQMQEAREARAVRERGGERFEDGRIAVMDAGGRIVSADARASNHFAGRRDIAGIEPSFLPVRTRLYLDAQARNRLPGQRDI